MRCADSTVSAVNHVIRLFLSGAVRQGHDVGFTPGEVPRVGGPNLGCFTAGDELFLGELADRLQRYDRPPPTLTDYGDLLTGSES